MCSLELRKLHRLKSNKKAREAPITLATLAMAASSPIPNLCSKAAVGLRLGLRLVWFVLFLSSVSCGSQSQQRTFFGSLQKEAQFKLDASGLASGEELAAYLIDKNGLRLGGSEYVRLDAKAGVIRLRLNEATLVPLDNQSPAEKLAALGEAVPRRAFSGWFSAEPLLRVSLELVASAKHNLVSPAEIGTTTKAFLAKYARYDIPLTRTDLLSTETLIEPLSADAALKTSTAVAFVPFSLQSNAEAQAEEAAMEEGGSSLNVAQAADSKSIEKSRIMALSLGTNEKTSKPIWQEPGYLPVFTKPNSSGKGYAGPIYYDAQTPQFQLFLNNAKGCTVAINPTALDSKKLLATLELESALCEDSNVVSSPGRVFWIMPKSTYLQQKVLVGNDQVLANLTNESVFTFSVAGKTSSLRKMDVFLDIFDESNGEKTRMKDTLSVKYFASRVVVVLDEAFAGGALRSTFLLSIAPNGEDFDKTKTEFLFQRSLIIPTFSLVGQLANTRIYSEQDVENRITASASSSVVIKSAECAEGRSFGVLAGLFTSSLNVTFFPCVDGRVTVPYTSIKDTSQASPIILRLFMRDEFGNLSEEDEETTRISVEIDRE